MTLGIGEQNPKDLRVTQARMLVYKVMVAAPVVLTLCIGVDSRTSVEPYEPIGYSRADNDVVTAYIPILKRAHEATIKRADAIAIDEVRQVSTEWIALTERGTLQPLRPAFYEDSSQDGAKGQITRANSKLSSFLAARARAAADQGRHLEAARDAVLAAELAQGVKYSDFQTVAACGMLQRRAFEVLERVGPHLGPVESRRMLIRLSRLRPNTKEMERMAARSRLLYFASKARVGEDTVRIEADPSLISLQTIGNEGPEEALRAVRNSLLASSERGPAPDYVSTVRFGFGSELGTQKAFAKTLLAIQQSL